MEQSEGSSVVYPAVKSHATTEYQLRIRKEADSEDDLRLLINVARAFAESGRPLSEDFPKIVRRALGACYMLNSVELARDMWQGNFYLRCLKEFWIFCYPFPIPTPSHNYLQDSPHHDSPDNSSIRTLYQIFAM